jgi:hypothetical protein
MARSDVTPAARSSAMMPAAARPPRGIAAGLVLVLSLTGGPYFRPALNPKE